MNPSCDRSPPWISVLLEAKELNAGSRAAFLKQSFPEESDAFIQSLVQLLNQNASPQIRISDAYKVGQEIGPYLIESVLGEGGMGLVYLAKDKNQPELKVALKTIRPNFINPSFLARFDRERQILARLSHPHIAALYSVSGETCHIPFLAMEYVEGTAIDTYCLQNKLRLGTVLDLFQEICDALDFAHQNLVIHRDIKPSNVLVNQHGHVKLLDFGIAGLIDEETKQQQDVTQISERMMSPDYASPEQLSGQPLSTTSDVFMLGTLLHKLLTGRLPYADEGTPAYERFGHITNKRLDMPSRLLQERTRQQDKPPIVHDLLKVPSSRKRELDAVLAKALEPDPSKRYQSVARFADDVTAWRTFGTLSVDNPGHFKLLWRYCLRNRKLVTTALSFCLLMAGFSTYLAYQSRQLQAERDAAQIERDTAERVTQFLVDLFEGSDAVTDLQEEISARELLDRGALSIDTDLAQQPKVKARLQRAMGRAYLSLAQSEKADALLRANLEYLQKTRASEQEIFKTMDDLNDVLIDQGRYQEAQAQVEEMIASVKRLRLKEPKYYLLALAKRGEIFLWQGKYQESEKELHALLKEPDFERVEPMLRIRIFNSIALLYQVQGRFQDSLIYFQKVFREINIVYPGPHRDKAKTLNNLGVLHSNLGNLDQSEKYYLESLEMQRTVYGISHAETSTLLANIAVLYQNKNDFDKAIHYYEEAESQLTHFFPIGHPYIAQNRLSLSSAYIALNQLDEAEKTIRIALSDMTGQSESPPAMMAQGYLRLAAVLIHKKEFDEAEDLLKRHDETLPREMGPDHPSRGNNALHLGLVYAGRGKTQEAIDMTDRAETIYLKRVQESHRWVQRTRIFRARFATEAGNYAFAETLLLKVRETISKSSQEGTQLHQECLDGLIKLYQHQKNEPQTARYQAELNALKNPG